MRIKGILATGSVTVLAALMLNGCGGSGGSDSPSPQTTQTTETFPLQAAYKALIENGEKTNYSVSGTCTGTASLTTDKPMAATFEGVPGISTAKCIGS